MSIHAIQHRISGVRARLRALYMLHGLCRIAFLAGAFVLTSFALDAWLHLPLAVRIGLQSLAGFGLVWLAWRHLLFPAFFPISADDIAKHVEREHPFLQGRLVATLQLSRLVQQPDYADSVAMTEALFQETEGLLGKVDFGRILRPGRVAKAGLFPMGAVAVLAGVAALWPIHARIWLARNVFFESISWPRATTVGLVARTWPVAPETAVPVSVTVGEEAGDVELVLHHRPLAAVEEEWSAAPLARDGDRFEGTIPGLAADAVFYLEILPVDRTALTYVPDPDRRSPYYVLSVDSARAPSVGLADRIEVALPEASIETSAGVYPVAAYVDGTVPHEVALVGTSESGQPIEIQLSRKAIDSTGEGGEVETVQTRLFERGLELAESCRFHLEAGDDSDEYPTWSVRVMVPPKLDQALVWMEYPEYMGRQDKSWTTYQEIASELERIRKETGSGTPTAEQSAKLQSFEARHKNALLEVERAERKTHIGSVVHLTTRANQPLSKAWLVFDRSPLAKDVSRIPIEPAGPDRRELSVSIDLDDRFDQGDEGGRDQPDVRRVEFHLEAVGDTGLATRRPTAYTLHVVRDKAPEFTAIGPFKPTESRIERAPVALVPFEAKVSDDYGITKVSIDVFTGDGDEQPTDQVVLFEHSGPGAPPVEFEARHAFDLELMERVETNRVGTRRRPLEDGDVVRFRVLATDNRKVERLGLEPQTREIGLYRISIISKGKVLEQTDKDLSVLKNLILEMRNREIRLRDATADLFTKLAAASAGELRKEGLELQSEQTDRITRAAEGIAVSLREVNDRFTVNNIESERPSHLVEMLPLIDAVAKDLSPAVAGRLDEMARGEAPEPRPGMDSGKQPG